MGVYKIFLKKSVRKDFSFETMVKKYEDLLQVFLYNIECSEKIWLLYITGQHILMNKKKKILITLPSLQDPGGVASFYNSLLPSLQNGEYSFKTLEIGKKSINCGRDPGSSWNCKKHSKVVPPR